MRTLKLLPLVVVVCSFVATASAQQVGVGDKIVVITDNAPLRSQDVTTGTAYKGSILDVKDVNGDWFWVISTSGKTGTVKGWIDRSDVIPFSQALDFFNEELMRNPTGWAYVIRGMIWIEKGEYDIAIGDFNEAIRLDPKDAYAYGNRGNAWNAKKEYDKAIADYDEAIRLDPKDAISYNNRGTAWNAKGEYDKAIGDYNEAIRLDPKHALPYENRGNVWKAKGEYDKAIADYNEAIRLDPKSVYGYWGLAWLFATCPDVKYRDGQKAVEMATKQCELSGWKDWSGFDNLAAAYAESGDFPNAVKWQEKAVELAPEKSQADCRSRLDLFKAHKPYREEMKR